MTSCVFRHMWPARSNGCALCCVLMTLCSCIRRPLWSPTVPPPLPPYTPRNDRFYSQSPAASTLTSIESRFQPHILRTLVTVPVPCRQHDTCRDVTPDHHNPPPPLRSTAVCGGSAIRWPVSSSHGGGRGRGGGDGTRRRSPRLGCTDRVRPGTAHLQLARLGAALHRPPQRPDAGGYDAYTTRVRRLYDKCTTMQLRCAQDSAATAAK